MQEAPQSPAPVAPAAPLPPIGKRNIPLVVFGALLLTVGISMLVSEHRALLQVKVEDADVTDEIFTRLMGDIVEPRRDFIQENALNVANLDV